MDERFSMVTGTSVGALTGGDRAGKDELAERLWCKLETSHVFDVPLDETLPAPKKWRAIIRLFSKAAVAQGGAGTGTLRRLLETHIREEQVRGSPLDFGLVTVQMNTLKPCYVWKGDIQQGRLVDYLWPPVRCSPPSTRRRSTGSNTSTAGTATTCPCAWRSTAGRPKSSR
jgi:NTE family protein